MIKILYCNNYAANKLSVENVKNCLYARHHLWGVYELCNDSRFSVEFSETPDMNVHKSKILRLLIILVYQIKLFVKFCDMEVIYSACSHQIDFFALMKHLGIFKGKLIVVVHHPEKILFSKSYLRIICISKYTERILKDKYGIMNSEYVFFGPDLSFYQKYKEVIKKKYDFYSNGKTLRDFSLVTNAFTQHNYKLLILTFEKEENRNVQTFKSVTDIENIRLACSSRVMLIPIKKGITQICGLTSLIDALALGMPFLISDSSNLGFSEQETKELLGGIVYKAGDKMDFSKRMKESIEGSVKNYTGFDFVQRNNYENFRKYILELILNNQK